MDYENDEEEQDQRETAGPQIDIREQLDDIWRHYLVRRSTNDRKVKLWKPQLLFLSLFCVTASIEHPEKVNSLQSHF